MSEPTFESWVDDGSPVAIEYSVVVLEEIRAEVSQGLFKFSRGGIEVGGILYGTHEGNKVRVQAMRPIACEHSNGPSFVLSGEDRVKLAAQITAEADDPQLKGLTRVGWYVSHTRAELAMTEADLELFSTYFLEPWQVTLVVRPGRGSQMRAGFFVREPDGTVKSNQTYKEFAFPDRLAGVMEATPRAMAERPVRSSSVPPLPPLPQPAPMQQAMPPLGSGSPFQRSTFGAQSPMFDPMPYPSPQEKKKWPWFVGGLAVLAILAFIGLRYYWQPTIPESLGLQVAEREGQLQIGWNNSSRTVVRATKGVLEIQDGDASERVPLTRSQLADGRYLYTRKGGDVEVRMQVESDGGPLSESARFLGRAPQAAAEANQIELITAEKASLEEENARLKGENARLTDRVQQLERAQRILEMRLGITGAK